MLKTRMAVQEEMALSPQQPLTRQRVRRIPGFMLTTGNVPEPTTGNVPEPRIIENIRIGAINVATRRDKEEEVVEMMKARRLDVLGMAETRLRRNGDRTIHEDYRLTFSGTEEGKHGVGFVLNETIGQSVEKVVFVNERIIGMDLRLDAGVSIIQEYAPQQGGTYKRERRILLPAARNCK